MTQPPTRASAPSPTGPGRVALAAVRSDTGRALHLALRGDAPPTPGRAADHRLHEAATRMRDGRALCGRDAHAWPLADPDPDTSAAWCRGCVAGLAPLTTLAADAGWTVAINDAEASPRLARSWHPEGLLALLTAA